MLIRNIKAKNFKTYLDLDLDLSVQKDRPIILIGGKNGGGKTTLFEAIYGALYGLKVPNKQRFKELLNAGSQQTEKSQIELEITFTGRVVNQEQTYVLRRTYLLNAANVPIESVRLNMNGTVFAYGTATPPAERAKYEQQVNKIIKANLPQELSRYFLFDAMEAGNLLKEDQLNHVIKENIENVMGFNKYLQLSRVSERIQQEFAAQRLEAEEEQKEYTEYVNKCEEKKEEQARLKDELDSLLDYATTNQLLYDTLCRGQQDDSGIQDKINSATRQIEETDKRINLYRKELDTFVADLETNVFLPYLAAKQNAIFLAISSAKSAVEEQQQSDITKEQLKEITHHIILQLELNHPSLRDVDEDKVVEIVIGKLGEKAEVKDEYDFLDTEETEAIDNLLGQKSYNSYPQLHQSHEQINIDIDNSKRLKQTIGLLKQQISGNDYSLIEAYESNEKRITEVRNKWVSIGNEVRDLTKKINNFDIQIQQEPDPKYDTLAKLKPFFDDVANELLRLKKTQIETKMKDYLNLNLAAYRGVIGRVELSEDLKDLTFHIYHKSGNEIYLSTLNAGAKQLVIQVLLKVLHELGDYDPPVMIDTVMGVLDLESRDTLMENYFPNLAEQTILLSTDTEIRTSGDYQHLEAFISKTYTLERNRELQNTEVRSGYFGIELNQ